MNERHYISIDLINLYSAKGDTFIVNYPRPKARVSEFSGTLSSPDSVGRNSYSDGWVMTPAGAAPAC